MVGQLNTEIDFFQLQISLLAPELRPLNVERERLAAPMVGFE
jgi:hypothetical protein